MNQSFTLSNDKVLLDKEYPLFSELTNMEHEQLVFCSRPEVGLKAIVAIHDTTLGPALGGTRMWHYHSEDEAIKDVLRLSRGMTYKAAISGLNFGGGKAVIIGDSRTDKTEAMFRAFGKFIDGLAGRYITAEDVGMTEREMSWIHFETNHVTGIPKSLGGGGDPSPVTAYGVYMGMKAAAKRAYGSDSLSGKRIGIQGAGSVATHLARYLKNENATLFVTDIFKEKAQKLADETGAKSVTPDDIYTLDLHIFSPCALGGVINSDTIPHLSCDIIAGGANNILDDEKKHARMLQDREILFTPDYVINAGGIINISTELQNEGYNEKLAMERTSEIYNTVLKIFEYADTQNLTPVEASNLLAEDRIQKVSSLQSIYKPKHTHST
ncbi:Glu/Leu/Phe/Val family dehydrogenase [Rhodohalobacter sulfatireducens]|uniref:Glu/Leu/Phe/Val family dehydrogenase n=1 Tax=Rhodohalobacter sulfatireducens TaxID=2911366 RepID=UPI00272D98AB|nr:Glu/Leu/Phe/Val dehydrogenase [Rhodohalobacter sulfatireducens]MDR9363959.1 Glu/Leu/Phe/Val dehydrogenase [Balneolaceae bacterium]MDR9407955.1 Glu/Leu/Phe/Val dehydrogenase [Balneolaceae bacterium]